MWTLGLDTSTERALFVLAYNWEVKVWREPPQGLQSSRYAMALIAEMTASQGLSPQDVGAIAVGVGPGSYTGMRVGVVIAKATAFALNIPVIPFCGMELFMAEKEGCAVVIDARMSGVYLFFDSSVKLASLKELSDLLPEKTKIVGPVLSRLQPQFPPNLWTWEERAPSPQRLIQIAKKKWDSTAYSLNGDVNILYLRETHAEFCKNPLL